MKRRHRQVLLMNLPQSHGNPLITGIISVLSGAPTRRNDQAFDATSSAASITLIEGFLVLNATASEKNKRSAIPLN